MHLEVNRLFGHWVQHVRVVSMTFPVQCHVYPSLTTRRPKDMTFGDESNTYGVIDSPRRVL